MVGFSTNYKTLGINQSSLLHISQETVITLFQKIKCQHTALLQTARKWLEYHRLQFLSSCMVLLETVQL